MNGFTITILSHKLKVRFIHPNEKVVVCFLDDGANEFKGISKCNFDAGDEYDIEQGENLALEDAILRRSYCYQSAMGKMEDKLNEMLYRQEEGLKNHYASKIKKFNKRRERMKKVSIEENEEHQNAQEETPPVEAYEDIVEDKADDCNFDGNPVNL
jgi:hypothetical protein